MKSSKYRLILIGAVVMLLVVEVSAQPKNQLSQISTIDVLMAGAYEGVTTSDSLRLFGNFGLGTFEKLDGEMIILNNNIYQAAYDGSINKNENAPAETPFAVVVDFQKEKDFYLKKIKNFETFEKMLSDLIGTDNLPAAVKVEGKFDRIKVRSVPPQEKPYKPLADVVKHQSVFEYENIEGTLVGFVLPDYFKSFNVPGLHIHFLSKNETRGGHVLEFALSEGNVEIDLLNSFYVHLPYEQDMFHDLDLGKDKSEELKKIER